MSLQIQDGHWYERRDGKVVQAKLNSLCSVSVIHQFDADGDNIGEPVFPATGSANYESGKCGPQQSDSDLIREVPAPTKLTLRVGGKYRRRDGEVVRIEGCNSLSHFPWLASNGDTYKDSGAVYRDGFEHQCDLVSEVLPEPPAKLSLKVGDRCLTRGGKEVVLTATPNDNRFAKSHPLQYELNCDLWTVRDDGVWGNCINFVENKHDIVSVLPPLEPPSFRITAGEYYTTRDGRCAYVACGPVVMPEAYLEGPAFFGNISDEYDPNIVDAMCWEADGTEYGEEIGENDNDLVATWSPPPYVCPHTGKTYNLVEATA